MNSNFISLTKIHLLGMTGMNRARYSGDGKEKRKAWLLIALYVFVSVLMLAFVTVYAILFAESGLNAVIPALSFALAAAIVLIFSLMRGPYMLFAMKDFDMLMSLPVKKSDIIASRLITSYLINLLFCAVIIAPCAVVYFIYGAFTAEALIYIVLAFILCPVLPIAVADILGTFITAATMNMRHKAILQAVLGMIALIAVLCLSFLLSYSSEAENIEISQSMLNTLLSVYPPAWLVHKSISGEGFWNILILVGISAAVAVAFVAVLSRFYLKINSALLSKKANGKFDKRQLKEGSPFAALFKNEFARLLSSPSYLLNSLSGLILLVLCSVVSLFVNPFTYFADFAEADPTLLENLKFLIIPVVMFMLGITTCSASSLSLEGNRRWIPFSLPVSSFTVLMAKSMMSLTLTGITGIICSAILTFSLDLSAVQAALLLISVAIYSLFCALFGTFINTKFPKYDWTSETNAVKNSASVTIFIFSAMLPPMALLFFGMAFESLIVPILVLDALAAAVTLLSLFALKKTRLCDQ